MNAVPPRAVVYLRVSTDEQKERGTIDNQRETAQSYSRLHQIPILDWYPDDGVSGSVPFAKRPEGARLLADAHARKFNLVLVTRIDRLARSTLQLLTAVDLFDRAGVAMRSMSEPFETSTHTGRFVLTMLGSIAQLEKDTIKERSRQGMERIARAGRWNGGKPPYGYRVDADGHLEIDAAEGAVVRHIFHLYTVDRLGTVRIAALLTAQGVPTPKTEQRHKVPLSGRWIDSTIGRILRNPQYLGTRLWGRLCPVYENGELIRMTRADESAHIKSEIPALIDDATFAEAVRIREQNFAWAKRNTKHDYLLRGLIRCADCGVMYSGISPNDRKCSYYFHPRRPECPAHRLERPAIEALVWENIVLYVRNPEQVIDRLAEQLRQETERAAPYEREFGGIEEAIAGKQAERARVLRLARRGAVTEAEAEQELGDLQQEIDALATRRDLLFGHREQSQSAQNRIVTAPALLRSLQERIEDESFASRREVVERLIRGITVRRSPEHVHICYCFDPGPEHVTALRLEL